MRRACLLIAILAACTAAPREGALSPERTAAMKDSVTQMLDAWRKALNAKDFEKTVSYYADDPRFRWIEDGQMNYSSRRDVAEAFKVLGSSVKTIDLSLMEPEVTPLGPGVALLTSNFAQKLTDTTGALKGYAGAVSAIIVHEGSGWKFLIGHTSSVPPTPAVPVRDSGKKRG